MGKLVCAFFSTKRSFPWLCFHPAHDFTPAVPNTPSSARPARGPRGPAPGLRPPAGVTGPSGAAPVSPPERGETGPGPPRPGRSRLLRFALVSERASLGLRGRSPPSAARPPRPGRATRRFRAAHTARPPGAFSFRLRALPGNARSAATVTDRLMLETDGGNGYKEKKIREQCYGNVKQKALRWGGGLTVQFKRIENKISPSVEQKLFYKSIALTVQTV